MFLKS